MYTTGDGPRRSWLKAQYLLTLSNDQTWNQSARICILLLQDTYNIWYIYIYITNVCTRPEPEPYIIRMYKHTNALAHMLYNRKSKRFEYNIHL